MTSILTPRVVRALDVDPRKHPRGASHVSAASGLVLASGRLFTVADDEHHLGIFDSIDTPFMRLHRLLPGDLPADKAERKKRKPDLEALVAVAGGLLALGSGSRPNRMQGIRLRLDEGCEIAGLPEAIHLGTLYAPLREAFADLNIEGAFVQGGRFHLLQRGHKGDARNACIVYDQGAFERWLDDPASPAPEPLSLQALQLGAVAGVPYGITDAAPLPGGGWIFSAVAEDTTDSYADGACAGSAIGWADATGVRRMVPIARSPKVEGIALAADGTLWMVTDADDPATASVLLSTPLP